jgi:small-conductance mechanosensitive channel
MAFDYFNLSIFDKGTATYQLLILLVFLLLLKIFFRLVVYKVFAIFFKPSPTPVIGKEVSVGKEVARAKARTVSALLTNVGNIIILGVATLTALEILGIDIRPLLAGVGILGLAVGFGSQTLIKDFVSGIFIIVENQYNVGDEVKIGSFSGKVVRISFRSTVLKSDTEGLIYISNGSISSAANMSQGKRNKR